MSCCQLNRAEDACRVAIDRKPLEPSIAEQLIASDRRQFEQEVMMAEAKNSDAKSKSRRKREAKQRRRQRPKVSDRRSSAGDSDPRLVTGEAAPATVTQG